MVGIIQDELGRMIAKVNTAKTICDSDCSRCAGDERLYGGLGLSRASQEHACPVGYGLAKRAIEYALKSSSDYQYLILSAAISLQKNSVENADPIKNQGNLNFLKTYLDLSKQEKHENIITNETVKLPEIATLPELELPKTSHVSSKARVQIKGSLYPLS